MLIKRRRYERLAFIGLMGLGLGVILGTSLAQAADKFVNVGDFAAPCGAPFTIGFVDCGSNTGGSGKLAETTINRGQTVEWDWRGGALKHTVTTQAARGSLEFATCGTQDNFDDPGGPDGVASTTRTFTHAFATAGDCFYFCQVHTDLMEGVVHVLQGGPTTTTTTVPTTTTTTTSTTTTTGPSTTTTTTTTVPTTTTTTTSTTTTTTTTTTSTTTITGPTTTTTTVQTTTTTSTTTTTRPPTTTTTTTTIPGGTTTTTLRRLPQPPPPPPPPPPPTLRRQPPPPPPPPLRRF